MLVHTYLLLPMLRWVEVEMPTVNVFNAALTKKAVVEVVDDGRELPLKSPLHRDCFKRSIITRGGRCGGGYGGEELSIEVKKRFRMVLFLASG